ncbi:MAG: SURF1 family protein, partial [Betaproteobacteria bacterium]
LGLWQAGKGNRLAAELAQHSERARLGPVTLGATLVNAGQMKDAPIKVRGSYESAQSFFLDNRQENGVAGLHVVTPLKIEGTQTRILVNRGWVGWPHGSRQALPAVATPQGVLDVSGIAAVPLTKKFLLMPEHAESRKQLWMQLDLQQFARQVAYPVQPVLLLQDAGVQDGLVRHWQPSEDRVARHRGYAWQWFGMALALALFFGYASVHRESGS